MSAPDPVLRAPDPDPAPAASPERARPVAESDRIRTLDVLRGFAVFGILLVNIGDFAIVRGARYDPSVSGGDEPWNRLVWLLIYLLADTKFLAIFTMLFGAGIALIDQRRRRLRERRAVAYYRRMVFLLVLGAMHGLLLWDGDILYYYAFWGMALYFAPRLPSWVLAIAGLAGIAAYGRIIGVSTLQYVPQYSWIELDVYRGGWAGQFAYRLGDSVFDYAQLPFLYAFHLLGHMLLGMALMKSGILAGRGRVRSYVLFAVAAFCVGMTLIGLGTRFDPGYDTLLEFQRFYWGSFLLSGAYITATVAVTKRFPRGRITTALAAVGRMALSNYLMHTVICTTLFYGYGFGLYERVDRLAQLGIVAAVCLVQLIASPLWLRAFRFGPVEWLWRSFSYWRWQPMRRYAEKNQGGFPGGGGHSASDGGAPEQPAI